MSDEPRYTLEEAREQLRKLECEREGHDFTILVGTGALDPESLICHRCGKTWSVSPSS